MRRVIAAVLLVFAAVSVCGCSSGKPGANSDRHIKLPYSIEESAKDRYYFMDRKFALTSDDMKVEKTELETAEERLEKHILTAADPAFDFTVYGRKFSDTVAEYNSKTEKLSDTDTSVRYRTVFEKSGGVTVTVVSELYREYPITEYTVYLENNGKENSPVISDFLALNTQMTAGDEVRLVSWKGSEASVSDFAPSHQRLWRTEKRSRCLPCSANHLFRQCRISACRGTMKTRNGGGAGYFVLSDGRENGKPGYRFPAEIPR